MTRIRLLTTVLGLTFLAACAVTEGDGQAFSGPGVSSGTVDCGYNNPGSVAPGTPCPQSR